ncbi:MBL fold metallo-hydrolase [Cohnella soli]|uniref:MBL fold metallo-hydrolase n=1 Tax=Cohnella soli TaxID=425005 RepID=A0ABW0HLR7_9BACL
MNDRFGDGTVTRLGNGWLQVKVPLPYSLKWVNAYLLPEMGNEDGLKREETCWTLIDPGLRTEEIERFWENVLGENRIEWGHIRSIVVTHHHPDHYGLAGWFQQKTGATVWMSQVALNYAERLWGVNETFSQELTNALIEHGLDAALIDDMLAHMSGFAAKVSPRPTDIQLLGVGETFRMGGIEWRIHGGEGHAPGHLLFHDAGSGQLLCGDQVLPDISPNIGWMPGGDPDPLGSFLDSLRQLEPLDVTFVYPGHRDPFRDYRGRVVELLEHHERRLRKMAELLTDGDDSDKSAFEVCELLFGARLRGNTHNLRFALAETIAHLEHMVRRGTAVRVEGATEAGAKRIFYRLVGLDETTVV